MAKQTPEVAALFDKDINYFVNPTGKFVAAGLMMTSYSLEYSLVMIALFSGIYILFMKEFYGLYESGRMCLKKSS